MSDFIPWPQTVVPRNLTGTPCDMLIGPCSCGAMHVAQDVAMAVLDRDEIGDVRTVSLKTCPGECGKKISTQQSYCLDCFEGALLINRNAIARAKTQLAERDAQCAAMREAFRQAFPFPLVSILCHLSNAVNHLFGVHNCDCDGWEKWSAANLETSDAVAQICAALASDAGTALLNELRELREALSLAKDALESTKVFSRLEYQGTGSPTVCGDCGGKITFMSSSHDWWDCKKDCAGDKRKKALAALKSCGR